MTKKIRRHFSGFPDGKLSGVPVPTLFFSELLPMIDDIGELKVTIYCIWALHQREGEHRYVRGRDILADQILLSGFDPDPVVAQNALSAALNRTLERGTLLQIRIQG